MIKRELLRFAIAFRGLFLLFARDSHGRFHFLALCVVIAAGFYFHVSDVEWIGLLLSAALVICAEGFNTAIEKLGDFVHQEKHDDMRNIKDISAGAVLITAMIAFVVACIVFIPKIL